MGAAGAAGAAGPAGAGAVDHAQAAHAPAERGRDCLHPLPGDDGRRREMWGGGVRRWGATGRGHADRVGGAAGRRVTRGGRGEGAARGSRGPAHDAARVRSGIGGF
jgi:hypothetical protein